MAQTNSKTLTFIEKLNAIQSELKAPKNQYNKFGGYKYRSCEDILEAVKPLLAKYGCVLNISDDIRVMGMSETDMRFYVKATAEISDGTDSINTTAYAREPLAKKGMDDSQITGTASSYARKYALNGLFCIDDTKDADTDEFQEQAKPAPKSKSVEKKQLDETVPLFEKKTQELLTLDEYKKRLEKCATHNDIQVLLNSQRGNMYITEMARLATARKENIDATQGV